MKKKQPAGCQKSSVCLCKKNKCLSLSQGEKKDTSKGGSPTDPADSKRLHLRLPASSPLQCIFKHSQFHRRVSEKIYTHCVCLQWREAGRKIGVVRSDLLKSCPIGRYTAMHPKHGAWHTEDRCSYHVYGAECLPGCTINLLHDLV